MATTIKISEEVKEMLDMLKGNNESYNEVILDLIEERALINKELLKELEAAKKEILAGKGITLEELKKKYGIK